MWRISTTLPDPDGVGAGAYDWVYDKLGRLDETKFSAQGYNWAFDNDYDDNSNRDKRELLRSGTTQFTDTFEFDDLNRQTKLTRDADNWGHDLRAELTYKADGRFDQIKRFNVLTGGTAFVTSHYGYDAMGRLTSLDHKNSGGTSITGYGWTYDAASRMKSMDFTNINYPAEDVAEFKYDRTDQLLNTDRTTDDEAYAYDGTGNRTTANGATYTTTTNNRLYRDGTYEYAYDDEGNRKKKITLVAGQPTGATTFYKWDHRNRLINVTKRTGPNDTDTVTETVDLVYDFANRLTRRDHDPDGPGGTAVRTDHYLWDGMELVGITGYNSLVFASGPAPDMVLFESATTLHALLGDHLNTVRDVISTSGTVENHLVYNSYGDLKSQTGGGAYSPFHRFTGKPFDVAVGLQYNVNRWYDAASGRWTSEDPIGFGGGHANLNAYTGNSPVGGVDSFGLWPVEPGGGLQTRTYQARSRFDGALLNPFSFSSLPPDLDAFEQSEKARAKAELDELIRNAPSMSEPRSEELALIGIDIILIFLTGNPRPAPAPRGSPRSITPYRDPFRPDYSNGATHIDHAQARALDGSNAASNLRPLAAETNLRKGGFEAELKAYEQYLIRNGMSPQDARSVIQAEIDALRISPPPRPMDPKILDQLPANPLDQGYPF